MIRINMIRQDERHPDRGKRHPPRASCEISGRRYEAAGPAPIYKLSTLLLLHGHGGERFEVWDDRDPFGKSGGLALHGRIRNWALLVKGKPNFTRKAKPDSDFIPDVRQLIAQAAGTVVDLDETRPASGLWGAVCATSPSNGPRHPLERDDASTGVVGARTPEAA